MKKDCIQARGWRAYIASEGTHEWIEDWIFENGFRSNEKVVSLFDFLNIHNISGLNVPRQPVCVATGLNSAVSEEDY
jgi:hypothetical protein